ncbi:hypothetical protein MCUN1_000852 [Malassezia cuniculi]|uniref:Uncharacterized protein n=1 Tax=Malassezia cuniculi TaxID=948313 RepID=A0AAF0ESL3_9BASI|nr:hypothetical protein MCUN1_000852 [Malassezia cuniculi]
MHLSGVRLDRSFEELTNASCKRLLEGTFGESLDRCLTCGSLPMHATETKNELHELNLAGNELTSFGASGLTSFVISCRTLVMLELQGNNIGPDFDDIAEFARALGKSNVQYLNISTNMLGPEGISVFFDTLPRSRLATLYISATFTEWEPTMEATMVHSIANYLFDIGRSRNLAALHMMGNAFSQDAHVLFVHTLLGSARSADASKFPDNATAAHVVRAQEPNVSLLLLKYAPEEFTNNLIKPPWWVKYSLYDSHKQPLALEEQLERNARSCRLAQRQATNLRIAARILGCRSKYNGSVPGVFPFAQLPSELKLCVLRHLAPSLNEDQFESVLSYACSASTIGYCCGLNTYARPDVPQIIPFTPWNWETCACRQVHTCPCHEYWDIQQGLDGGSMPTLKHAFSEPFHECTGTNVAPRLGSGN